MRRLLLAFLFCLCGSAGCSTPDDRRLEREESLHLLYPIYDRVNTDVWLAHGLARQGRTGQALRLVQACETRLLRHPLGPAPYFMKEIGRLRGALTNAPLELAPKLVDLEEQPPQRRSTQPMLIRKLLR